MTPEAAEEKYRELLGALAAQHTARAIVRAHRPIRVPGLRYDPATGHVVDAPDWAGCNAGDLGCWDAGSDRHNVWPCGTTEVALTAHGMAVQR